MWIYLLSDFHFGLYTFAWKSLCMTQTKGFLSIKLLHQWDSPLSHGLSIPPKPSTSSIWHMKMQPRAFSLQVIDSLITPGEHHALRVPTRARQASAQPRPRIRIQNIAGKEKHGKTAHAVKLWALHSFKWTHPAERHSMLPGALWVPQATYQRSLELCPHDISWHLMASHGISWHSRFLHQSHHNHPVECEN